LPYRENDPIIIRDYDYDVEVICPEDCICTYL
jgi:hypothetical protein